SLDVAPTALVVGDRLLERGGDPLHGVATLGVLQPLGQYRRQQADVLLVERVHAGPLGDHSNERGAAPTPPVKARRRNTGDCLPNKRSLPHVYPPVSNGIYPLAVLPRVEHVPRRVR